MINAGQLNRRVEICELTDGINPETGRDEGQKYVPVCTVWANVKHVRGSEYFTAAAVNAERTVTFTIRYKKILTEDHYIKYGGTYYNIRAIRIRIARHTNHNGGGGQQWLNTVLNMRDFRHWY